MKQSVTKMIAIHVHFFHNLYAKLRACSATVFYPGRQRCFGDVKMKHEKRAHKLVKQELVMVSEKVTL